MGSVFSQLRALPGPGTCRRYFLLVLAGPAANLISALAVLPFILNGSAISGICAIFAIASILIGLLQFVPVRTGPHTSDGAKLFLLLFSKKRRNGFLFLLSFSVRVEEIDNLLRARQFEDALRKSNEMISTLQKIPNVVLEPEFWQRLLKLRDSLEFQLSSREAAEVSSAPGQG